MRIQPTHAWLVRQSVFMACDVLADACTQQGCQTPASLPVAAVSSAQAFSPAAGVAVPGGVGCNCQCQPAQP